MIYDNAPDAHTALGGTVIMYNDRGVYVHDCREGQRGITLRASYLPERGSIDVTAPLTDPLWNYMNLRVGYIQGDVEAFYAERFPARRNRQGLNSENVLIKHNSGVGFNGFRHTQGLADMLVGKYPTLQEALKRLENKTMKSVALSRQMALSRDHLRGDFLLEWKGEPIGFGDLRGLQVSENFKYLEEAVKEAGINVR